MKSISQKEKFYIEQNSKNVHIVVTSKTHKSKRKRYTVEEVPEVERLLKEFHASVEKVIEKHGWFVENGKNVYYV